MLFLEWGPGTQFLANGVLEPSSSFRAKIVIIIGYFQIRLMLNRQPARVVYMIKAKHPRCNVIKGTWKHVVI